MQPAHLLHPHARFENVQTLPTGLRLHHDDLVHEQVVVTISRVLGGGKTYVDVGLAQLLATVWSLRWPTFASCEDWGDGTAQVVFDRCHDAMEFVASLPFGDRVQVKLLNNSSRRGPLVDRPVAVYLPTEWVPRAVIQLRHRALYEYAQRPATGAEVPAKGAGRD